ncbi:hypothetical protein PZB75_30230 [Streptomyces sp. AM 4-1-1]|uniref:hypothetical protein n=1 Tax=Streptomyces sp. AM 4-1-1 TaxID=3028710 RepID=UPI0023B9F052|nr:hypothetical protein [Streptomyces sp. AM 4-1-1]WEH37267.1 hypothetical protein PZB75_30230 [Streptomyces sp. AM 4-1-1]
MVIEVDATSQARHPLGLRHAEDQDASSVVGQSGNVLSQLLFAFVAGLVVIPLIVEILRFGRLRITYQALDVVVTQVVQPRSEQIFQAP